MIFVGWLKLAEKTDDWSNLSEHFKAIQNLLGLSKFVFVVAIVTL